MTPAQAREAGGYQVVLADPPWRYGNAGVNGAAEKHYRTMTPGELADLAVPEVSAEDACLFLWSTWPMLPEALRLCAEWGFAYKTLAFLWVKRTPLGKEHFGAGWWTRANTEPCLLATRGRPERVSRSVRQLVEAEAPDVLDATRGRHSDKPACVRDRVVALCGDVPRIELFARDRVDGWDAFGDEVPGGSDVAL